MADLKKTIKKMEAHEPVPAEDTLALLKEYKDCVNELCYECGHYKQEHEGACADCRWLRQRRGW